MGMGEPKGRNWQTKTVSIGLGWGGWLLIIILLWFGFCVFIGGSQMAETEKCIWKYNETEERWDTQCNENRFKFCPFCGKPLEENRVAEHEEKNG